MGCTISKRNNTHSETVELMININYQEDHESNPVINQLLMAMVITIEGGTALRVFRPKVRVSGAAIVPAIRLVTAATSRVTSLDDACPNELAPWWFLGGGYRACDHLEALQLGLRLSNRKAPIILSPVNAADEE